MSVENMQRLVARCGTEAVQLYERMSGEGADGTPEQFLEGIIAERLYKSLSEDSGYRVHVERLYEKIAEDLRVLTPELKHRIGSWEADIAIYEAGVPTHIVELKKFGQTRSIKEDLDKIRKIETWPVSVLLGVLAFDKPGRDLIRGAEELRGETGLTFDFQPTNRSFHGNWYWSFACLSWKTVEPRLDVEKFLDGRGLRG